MKKIMSVRELKKYCEDSKPHKIIFCTENQSWYSTAEPCKIKMSFPIMLIFENPNLICLMSGSNTLSLDRVKYAEINTGTSVLGDVVTVFCGDFNSDKCDITYTLVVA